MNFLLSVWYLLCELSPWLLLGMFLSGLLHVVLPSTFVRRELQGFSGVLKSVAIGVPLPLCSCGVIPTGIGLKKDGASNGAAIGFLISTPQTGVDSMLVSASFFGWPFAVFKLVSAAMMGIAGGVWIDAKREPVSNAIDSEAGTAEHSHGGSEARSWGQLLPHAIDMLRSIWVWLVIGILISAAINLFDIQPLTAEINRWGLLPAMLLVLVFSIPLYVCATASVPIAAALVGSGLPPAVALVFLMAGPATNVATMGAIRANLGTRSLVIYLSTIIMGSMVAAYLFDSLISVPAVVGGVHVHDVTAWWAQISAGIVLGLVGWFGIEKVRRRWRTRSFWPAASTPAGGVERDAMPHGEEVVQTISIQGMSCGNCVRKLETLIEKQPGVRSVTVSLADGQAMILGDCDLDLIKQKINDSGFVPH